MSESSVLRGLFRGELLSELLLPYPDLPANEQDETLRVIQSIRKFCTQKVNSTQIDEDEALPIEVLKGAQQLGLMGLAIPKEYGGKELSVYGFSRAIEELSFYDASLAVTLGTHQSIGLYGFLKYGTPDQKKRWLPDLAAGRKMAAFALTEEGAGSDVSGLQTQAKLSENGRSYVLEGKKVWVTNGGLADCFTVVARTATNEGQKPKLTVFMVERGPGVQTGHEDKKLGIRGTSTTSLKLNNVAIPAENVIGEPGRGFKIAMEILNAGRLSLAAGCIGVCKKLIKLAVERATKRKAFGRMIGDFGLIKDKIALMSAELWAVESATYLTHGLVARGQSEFAMESAVCKIIAGETVWRIANETLQIAAGLGYMRSHPYERMFRDARVNLIYQGSNEIMRCFVALSGIQSSVQKLTEAKKPMGQPLKAIGLLSKLAVSKAKTTFMQDQLRGAHSSLAHHVALLENNTALFARAVTAALRKHGTQISEMQYTQRRLADIAIDLFCVGAVISRATRALSRRGFEGARREMALTEVFVGLAATRMVQNFAGLSANDDELRKAVAERTYSDGGYPFDSI